VFEYADVLLASVQDTNMAHWHEDVAETSLLFWANFVGALRSWQKSDWGNLMAKLQRMDELIETLESTDKPTDPK